MNGWRRSYHPDKNETYFRSGKDCQVLTDWCFILSMATGKCLPRFRQVSATW
jgi:hypothetical protein